jgi:FMN phosphatase YigB (HAD superfamily)
MTDPMEKAKKLCEENGWNLDIVPKIAQSLKEAREEGAASALDRIEELEKECERWFSLDINQRWEISKLSLLLREAVEVIKPFAEYADDWRCGWENANRYKALDNAKNFLTKAKIKGE